MSMQEYSFTKPGIQALIAEFRPKQTAYDHISPKQLQKIQEFITEITKPEMDVTYQMKIYLNLVLEKTLDKSYAELSIEDRLRFGI